MINEYLFLAIWTLAMIIVILIFSKSFKDLNTLTTEKGGKT